MNKVQKDILKKLVISSKGLLSPAEFINSVAQRDNHSVQVLITGGYVEEVPQNIQDLSGSRTISFYRATKRGRDFFNPWYVKFLQSIKVDLKTIIVSAITSLVTTFISLFFSN